MSKMREREKRARTDRSNDHFLDALSAYREVVLERMVELIPSGGRYHRSLYGPMIDYPLREGKGFRPALLLAMCQACGGESSNALDTAVALEMFHNAFLIHDDSEDGSHSRRGEPTLHLQHGLAIATNVGDALNMLALSALLGNTGVIGLERSLTVIEDISRMARETTEGQSIELDWVAGRRVPTSLRDYLLMTYKKTTWYTCIAPMRLGAIIADVPPSRLEGLVALGFRIGAAFQIQDDILNLVAEEALYGKEANGDVAEGKRTVMVIHAMTSAGPADRALLEEIYAKPRLEKTDDDIKRVLDAFDLTGSVDFARGIADRLARSAEALFERRFGWIPPGPHRRFIEEMIDYMITRLL
jgi:geranylgeranyl diphosphate synthase type II